MLGSGLGMKIAQLRNNMPTKKCTRCEMRYTVDNTHCPHCHELSDSQLLELKEKISIEHEGNSNLGKIFIVVAIVLFGLMVLVAI